MLEFNFISFKSSSVIFISDFISNVYLFRIKLFKFHVSKFSKKKNLNNTRKKY